MLELLEHLIEQDFEDMFEPVSDEEADKRKRNACDEATNKLMKRIRARMAKEAADHEELKTLSKENPALANLIYEIDEMITSWGMELLGILTN
jgi:hypothetical protein